MLSRIEMEVLRNAEVGVIYDSKAKGMNRDAVMKAIFLLKEKGFAEVFERKKKRLKVTPEGKRYLLEGFPEEKLIRVLSETNEINELRKKLGKEFEIAVGWLKKKGLLEISNGKLKLLGRVFLEEKDALISVDRGMEINEEIEKVLERRKLI
ncbi:MAG: phenylalanine--tRNA ligase subunit alpha, partial [Archaeoglobaceae archaeon]